MEELLAIDELETGIASLEEAVSLDKGRTEELLSATDDIVSDDSSTEDEDSTGPDAPPPSQAARTKAIEIIQRNVRILISFNKPILIRSLHNGLGKLHPLFLFPNHLHTQNLLTLEIRYYQASKNP
jgi:hypothetical protein